MSAPIEVRILHRFESPDGWWFTSPDVEGLTGSDSTFVLARARAEDVVRWHLSSEAEEAGEPAPVVEFEHFIHEDAAASVATV